MIYCCVYWVAGNTLLQAVYPVRENHLHAEFGGNEDLKLGLNVHCNIFKISE